MNAPAKPAEVTTALATAVAPQFHVAAPTGRDLILHTANLDAMVRVSEFMANSKGIVPKHLRGNVGGCLAVTMQAMRWNMDPFALATKTYQVDDNPIAYEGQAIIAALNNSPLLVGRLQFDWGGPWEKIIGRFTWKESQYKDEKTGKAKKYLAKDWDDNDEKGLWCSVSATLVGEEKPRVLELQLMQARVRNSPLWTEDPKQQLAYLAARRWGRLHASDVIMGVYTPDELQDFSNTVDMGEVEQLPPLPPELMANASAAAAQGKKVYAEFWRGLTHMERALLDEVHRKHEELKERAEAADKARTVDNTPRSTPAPTPAPEPTPAPTPAPTEAPAAPDAGGPPTYAKVMEMMLQAMASPDARIAMEIAGEWIGDVADPAHRAELSQKYAELMAQLDAQIPPTT